MNSLYNFLTKVKVLRGEYIFIKDEVEYMQDELLKESCVDKNNLYGDNVRVKTFKDYFLLIITDVVSGNNKLFGLYLLSKSAIYKIDLEDFDYTDLYLSLGDIVYNEERNDLELHFINEPFDDTFMNLPVVKSYLVDLNKRNGDCYEGKEIH